MSEFSCALSEEYLLHGRIFITNKKLVFYSLLDSNNNSFGKTLIEVNKEDIIKIEKESNPIFNNMLLITTKNGKMLFTYFNSRDQCYDNIKDSLINSYKFDNNTSNFPLTHRN